MTFTADWALYLTGTKPDCLHVTVCAETPSETPATPPLLHAEIRVNG